MLRTHLNLRKLIFAFSCHCSTLTVCFILSITCTALLLFQICSIVDLDVVNGTDYILSISWCRARAFRTTASYIVRETCILPVCSVNTSTPLLKVHETWRPIRWLSTIAEVSVLLKWFHLKWIAWKALVFWVTNCICYWVCLFFICRNAALLCMWAAAWTWYWARLYHLINFLYCWYFTRII